MNLTGLTGIVLIFLILINSLIPHQLSAESGRNYNVLFIIADDLKDYVGSLKGHPLVETPSMDRLADSAVTLTNAQANAGWCAPSRASFLTGIAPRHSGIIIVRSDQQRS